MKVTVGQAGIDRFASCFPFRSGFRSLPISVPRTVRRDRSITAWDQACDKSSRAECDTGSMQFAVTPLRLNAETQRHTQAVLHRKSYPIH
jgi:hypothetical protein